MATTRLPKQIIAPQPSTTRAAPVHLSVDSKGTKIAYASNKAIYLRDLEDPANSIQYKEHLHPTTVAKFSPSGYYIASGDTSGLVRIWGCDTPDQILKNEVKVINGRITDLSWDGDSQRIIAVGEGKERWGHAFTFDAGNAVGDITGHSAVPNAVAIKQSRPVRAATAGDDGLVVFYHGAPYKYEKSMRKHTKFVYGVKFSPDGSKLVSVGADARIFVYDGKTGDDLAELKDEENGHTGSIFAVSWDPTSKFILTSSADETAKVWDVEQGKVVNTWQLKEDRPVDGQQVGNVWTEKYIISLSFSGKLNYLSRDADAPLKVVGGHQKSLTALAASSDGKELYTGSYDATAYHWLLPGATTTPLTGASHSNSILQMTRASSGFLSIGLDDSMKTISGTTYEQSVATEEEAKGLGVLGDGTHLLATVGSVRLYSGKDKTAEIKTSYKVASATAASDVVAIGSEDSTIYIYDAKLAEKKILRTNRANVTALALSQDGTKLAAGDGSGKIVLYDTTTGEPITTRWAFHVGRIASLQFSPSGTKVISASLDTHIYVWSVATPAKKIAIKNAHQGSVSGAVWLSEDDAVSSGADGALKFWDKLSF